MARSQSRPMDPDDYRLSMRVSPRARDPKDNEGLRRLILDRFSDTIKAIGRLGLRTGGASVFCEGCNRWTATEDFAVVWSCPCGRRYRAELIVYEELLPLRDRRPGPGQDELDLQEQPPPRPVPPPAPVARAKPAPPSGKRPAPASAAVRFEPEPAPQPPPAAHAPPPVDDNTPGQRMPTERPGYLRLDQYHRCGRCGFEVNAIAPHLCIPRATEER